MTACKITPDAALANLNNGARTIWDLASLFGVASADPDLRSAVDKLIADGAVVASGTNIYSATLEVQ